MKPSPSADAIYLDFNATTPVLPEVLEAMLPYLRDGFGNPSSDHARGVRAREAIDCARVQVATLIGASPEEIIFTSCATESSNLAIRGVAAARSSPGRIVTSTIEHPATTGPCEALEEHGWMVTRVPPGANGIVDPEDFGRALGPDVVLVTLIHANNEIGTIQPVAEVTRRAHALGAVVHTDAAQSVGKIPVGVDDLGVDLLTLAGHKLYAPKGVGALYVRRGTTIRPVLRGGGQERGLRPGTENVALIVGLGCACELAGARLASDGVRLRELRNELWRMLRSAVPGLALNGDTDHRLPNTLSVRFPRVSGAAVLDAAGEIAASTGSACHSGELSPSETVLQLGVGAESALGTVRLSLGITTTVDQVTRAAQALVSAWRGLTDRGAG
jgi:cysteine desulfurase